MREIIKSDQAVQQKHNKAAGHASATPEKVRIKSFVRKTVPPPGKVSILRIFYPFVQFFFILGPFRGAGGGVKPRFCGGELYGHPDFSDLE